MKELLYHINPYAQFRNYLYARICLRKITVTPLILNHYHLKDEEGVRIENPKWSKAGFLYLILLLPEEIKKEEIKRYVKIHSKFLIDFALELNLYNIVKISTKMYLNKYPSDDSMEMVIVSIKPKLSKLILLVFSYLFIVFITNEILNYYGIISFYSIYS